MKWDYPPPNINPVFPGLIIVIIINNFFFVGIIQHFKILQIVFRPKKLIKANYKPSKMKVLKDTFLQSFNIFVRTSYLLVGIKRVRTCKHTHAHMDYKHNYIIIYTQTYPYTHIDWQKSTSTKTKSIYWKKL